MNEVETTCKHGTKILLLDGCAIFDKKECWKCAEMLAMDYIVEKWKKYFAEEANK